MRPLKLGTRKWNELRKRILVRDLYQCRYGYPGCMGVATEVDHFIDRSWGGHMWDEGNLYSTCHACHLEKPRRRARGEALRPSRFSEQRPPDAPSLREIPPRNTRYAPITSDYSREPTEGKEKRPLTAASRGSR